MNRKQIISWALAVISALILLQTLQFKFTAHPESVEIFSKLGIEPWGRIFTGVMELICGVLLLIPGTRFWGSLVGLGLMTGAIISHILVLGIESNHDGGQLFLYALITFFSCLTLLFIHKKTGIDVLKRIGIMS